MAGVTNTGFTGSIPDNTVQMKINWDAVDEFEADAGTITAGMLVSYTAAGHVVVLPADDTNALMLGVALDNTRYNSTTRLAYAYDDAYPDHEMVKVALLGGGHLVKAISTGTTTAGDQQMRTNTAGKMGNGDDVGKTVGTALTDDDSDGYFVLQMF